MGRRGRSASSVSTFQVMGAVIFILLAVIVAGYLFAPEKPLPPPASVVTYEAPPVGEQRPSRPPAVHDEASTSPVPSRLPEPAPTAEIPGFLVQGTVTSARTGDPVRGARVTLRRRFTAEDQAAFIAQAEELAAIPEQDADFAEQRTGGDGTFALSASEVGTYLLIVRHDAFLPHDPQELAVVAEQATYRIDVALSPGAAIRGRVTESGSKDGAAGVEVLLGVQRADMAVHQFFFGGFDLDRTGKSARTDDNGDYAIEGIAAAEYNVSLNLQDTPYRAGKVVPYRQVEVEDTNQDVRGVDFIVDPAGMVWGYVKFNGQEPVAADVVLCTDESVVSQMLTAAVRRAPPIVDRSDKSDGYYALNGVPLNEEWRVYATSKDVSPQMSDPFILTPRQRNARVDISLFAGTNLSGRVIDTARKPIEGAEVVCFTGVSKLFSRIDTPPAMREARSGADGTFLIKQLPAGTFQLHATKKGFKLSARGEPVYADGYNDIVNFDIVLHPIEEGTEQVFGQVLSDSGQAVQGATLNLNGMGMDSLSGLERSTESAADGSFLFDGVEPGMYVLSARADGYSTKILHRVRLNEHNLIVLEEGASIAGTVLVRETGVPLAGARVNVMPINEAGEASFATLLASGGQGASGGTDQDGRFDLAVRAGRFRVEARQARYTPGRIEVEVKPGQRQDGLRIYVSESGGSIEGRVTAHDRGDTRGTMLVLIEGQSVAETAMLLAASPDASSGRVARAGDGGVFRFDNLGAGVYNVVAQHPSYPRGESGMLELRENQQLGGVEVRLGAGGGIEGIVYRNKQPVPEANVMAMANGLPQFTNADSRGYYLFNGLAAGTYQLMVVPEGIGDLTNITNMQSVNVEVTQNRVTWQDLGDALGGITLLGQCEPRPPDTGLAFLSGFAQLRSPETPPMLPLGQSADLTLFTAAIGRRGAVIDREGRFQFENVPPGPYALDVYYPEGFTARFVWTQPVDVPADAEEVPIVVQLPQEQ